MKILTPATTADLKAQEQSRDLLRAMETRELTKEINIERANADADFQATLAKNREVWAAEELEHAERKREMGKEIEQLEAERISLLVPVGIISGGAENRLDEAIEFMRKLREREENVDILTEKLMDKLDEVGEREQTVRQREQKAQLREMGIKNQYDSTIEGSKQLSKQITDFAAVRGKAEKEIKEKQDVLIMKEQSLLSREASLAGTEQNLKDREVRLKDERGTLSRAWAELERMRLIPIEKTKE